MAAKKNSGFVKEYVIGRKDQFVFARDNVEKMIRYCYSHYHREIWYRNALIIKVLAFTGVRIGEFERINIEDIDLEKKLLHVR